MKAAVVAIALTACVLMLIPAASWQRQVSALMGIEGPTTAGYLRTLIVAAVVGAVLVSTFRVLIDAVKLLARMLIRRWHLHDEVALFIGTAIVVALLITLIDGVLVRGFFAGANAVFQPRNTATPAGVSQPQLAGKVRQPTSLAPWDTLGYQGRDFVATGPHAAELARLNGRPAKEPDPGVRRAAHRPRRPRPVGRTRRRTRAHRCFQPQGTGHRADHRHRLDRPGGGQFAGDDVQRRHRDRRSPVFLSAELDLVPGRPAEVDGLRPDADQRGP